MGPPPAWPGFRSLRVSRKLHESSNVTSLVPAQRPFSNKLSGFTPLPDGLIRPQGMRLE